MSTLSQIEGQGGEAFLDKLHSFVIFEIHFRTSPYPPNQRVTTIRVPGFLACQCSTRFREANDRMGNASRTELNLAFIFGSERKLQLFQEQITSGRGPEGITMIGLFNAFVKWLYTGQLYYVEDGYSFYDMMRLAEVLGAPKLYNTALQQLSTAKPWYGLYDNDDRYTFVDINSLQEVMGATDFDNGYPLLSQSDPRDIYWADKKRLLFVLDCFVKDSMNSLGGSKILGILKTGGDLAALVGGRMVYYKRHNYARYPGFINFYRVNEKLPDYSSRHTARGGGSARAAIAGGTSSSVVARSRSYESIVQRVQAEVMAGANGSGSRAPKIKQEDSEMQRQNEGHHSSWSDRAAMLSGINNRSNKRPRLASPSDHGDDDDDSDTPYVRLPRWTEVPSGSSDSGRQ